MPRYLLTPAADGDIDGIWRYVWEHAPNAADELVAKAYRAFDLLTDNPGMGKVRTELRGEPRSFPMTGSPYVVFYRPSSDGVLILRVIHASRDLDTIY
jgi:toxin ParE1/3/4